MLRKRDLETAKTAETIETIEIVGKMLEGEGGRRRRRRRAKTKTVNLAHLSTLSGYATLSKTPQSSLLKNAVSGRNAGALMT